MEWKKDEMMQDEWNISEKEMRREVISNWPGIRQCFDVGNCHIAQFTETNRNSSTFRFILV